MVGGDLIERFAPVGEGANGVPTGLEQLRNDLEDGPARIDDDNAHAKTFQIPGTPEWNNAWRNVPESP